MNNPEFARFRQQLEAKLVNEGFERFEFKSKQKANLSYHLLIGVQEDGTKDVLSIYVDKTKQGKVLSQVALIEKYIRS